MTTKNKTTPNEIKIIMDEIKNSLKFISLGTDKDFFVIINDVGSTNITIENHGDLWMFTGTATDKIIEIVKKYKGDYYLTSNFKTGRIQLIIQLL